MAQAGDHIPISGSASATGGGSAARATAGDVIQVSTSATAGPSGGVTAGDVINVSTSATARQDVLIQAPAARLTVRGSSGIGVTVTPRPESVFPDTDIGLAKNQWDLTTTGFGAGIGLGIAHVPGMIIGGAVFYAWGQWRWRQRVRSR